MQEWLSYHFYPLETADVFLTRAVRPFLEQFIWNKPGTRAFFIRYDDEKGLHIRLRLRGEQEWLEETLRPALEGWFAERGERVEVPYDPETTRFGGEEAMAWAEEHFHISTRVVLERLQRPQYTYGDALFDALRLHTMTIHAAGITRERAAWYFGQLYELWLPLFFKPAEDEDDATMKKALLENFESNYTPQAGSVRATLDNLWDMLNEEKFDPKQPEWLRWYRGNQLVLKEFGAAMEKALPSLLHLTTNRLGISNQEEVYLMYVLSKSL
ncbi:MAG TPA: thiopeptide-type bacteriocin biosynthesis protein, partial [Saprospiraceae bacterium]|nr:thiopeptide-type bacteriocin biosynthesis protein [Saprospiraceae bacterium]HPI07734.1 thiopeptide-type bacteriocin biosynthesis protein [Saprospiraceae bacterium]